MASVEVLAGPERRRRRSRIYERMETEIALQLGDDLPEALNPQQVAAAVGSCMAAIELIEDLRYDYKRLDAAAMVAGNGWNAGVVLGTPMTVGGARSCTADGALSINGREIGEGKGGDVMGHPLNARLACRQTCGGGDTVGGSA